MKRKLIPTIPEIFSLRANSDYSRFIVQGGAGRMMHDTWSGIGRRLGAAMQKVGNDVEKKPIA